jgi:hypothetical protein
MSYIKSPNTYAYPDGDGSIVINTNSVCDQSTSDIGHPVKQGEGGRYYRWVVVIDESDFRQLVREILVRSAPGWVKPKMIEQTVDRFMAGEKVE